jgi:protein tyrosine phosphatase domain-containing protein 1
MRSSLAAFWQLCCCKTPPSSDQANDTYVIVQVYSRDISICLSLPLQVGEHDSCGPGNLSVSGFTYNPETFMAARIGMYNISWRDMGVPTLEKIMDIVQVGT